jgi:hypothetical protein
MKQTINFASLVFILILVSSCGNLFKYRKAGFPSENDYKFFASRRIDAGTEPFRFHVPHQDMHLGTTIELDSRKIDASDIPLDLFLQEHKTLSFLIIRNDTILYQYYDASKSDTSIVTSFSVAKAFISGLVGIAISDGLAYRIYANSLNTNDYLLKI